MKEAVAIGVDVGSTTWKAVAVDAEGKMCGRHIEGSEPNIEVQTRKGIDCLRQTCSIADNAPMGATGYGRKRVANARHVTEITCHGRGAFSQYRQPCILIDIGGQDSKVIYVGATGTVVDFAMNDKCAAGTGRFVEVALHRLGVEYSQLQALVQQASRATPISSTCTVFAESEVVSLVAQGEPLACILLGLHTSFAARLAPLVGGAQNDLPLLMSGGVALNAVMVACLSDKLGKPIEVVQEPQYVGALGAALTVLPTQ